MNLRLGSEIKKGFQIDNEWSGIDEENGER